MAETVHFYLERMVPELQDLEEHGIFSKEEIKAIVARRTDSEYKLKRRIARKADYLRYIQAEMNLDRLRQRRRARVEIKGVTLSDYSLKQRVHFLFVRALRKFGGDKRLWLQHIQYCRQTQSTALLLRAFAGAIQAHPLEPGFWIMAAAYEFEEANNIKAARALFHRGLRLNRESHQLWLEYCRMELAFVERMRERRRVLGLPANATASARVGEAHEQASVQVPAMAAEANAEGSVELPNHAGDEPRDFFSNAIPLLVFRNAVKANPDSLELRLAFTKLFALFTETTLCIDAVYESIHADFANSPAASAAHAFRPLHLLQWASATAADAKAAITGVAQALAAAAKQDSAVWGAAAEQLHELAAIERVDELGLKPDVLAHLVHACEAASAAGALQPRLYGAWSAALDATKTSASARARLLAGLEAACNAHPADSDLWLLAVRTQLRQQGGVAAAHAIAERADAALADRAAADCVVAALLDHLIAEHADAASLQAAFERWAVHAGRVRPSVGKQYISWAAATGGLARAREVYDALLRLPGAPLELLEQCLQLEATDSSPEGVARRRHLFDLATAAAPTNGDLWLRAISSELDAGEFERANQLYWRAMKVVEDTTDFVARYNAL